jgi:hypothetical protein
MLSTTGTGTGSSQQRFGSGFNQVSGRAKMTSCAALYRTQLPSLSATRDRSTVIGPYSKSVRTRSKFIQLTVVGDINAKAVEA